MKDKFNNLISKLKNVLTKWNSLDKVKKILSISIVCFVIVAVIFIIFLINRNEPADTPVAVTATPTSTPTPTPSPSPSPTPLPTPTPSPTPTPDPYIGMTRSRISGEWLKDEVANQRPYAIMFNNIEVANPQSGIGEAVIVYEALAEAGISRLMGLFENLDENSSLAERIGSVRSARHYFVSFADEYDAIFIHYGRTTYAEKKIKKLKIDHLDGTDGIGSTVYYRDNNIKAPHNAFASLEGIHKGIEKLNIRTEHEEGYEAHYKFYDEDTTPKYNNSETTEVERINLGFSGYMSPYLTYDKDTKLYTRYQFGDVHIDYNTGKPLEFKNVIIQLVEQWNKDKNGYQTMDIEDSHGKGLYFTNGIMTEITWEKNEKNRFMRYYDIDGNELTINTGKTYIAVYPNSRTDKLSFE